MAASKRASYASKQIRAGPAPLASFEDLPSDEMESPEDSASDLQLYASSSAPEDDTSSQDQYITTPDSLTISSQSTQPIDCDSDSQLTLTPGEEISIPEQPSFDLRTTSMSSLPKENPSLNVKHKKASAVSLGTIEMTTNKPSDYNLKKSSWGDLFRRHNQNGTKSSNQEQSKEKTSRKKSREKKGDKSKDRGKFFSMFKKKTNKTTVTAEISPNVIETTEDRPTEVLQSLPEVDIDTVVSNGAIPKGKENEIPANAKTCSMNGEAQNDLGKLSDGPIKIPDEGNNQKLVNITESTSEKELNTFCLDTEEKCVDKLSKSENIQAIVEEEPQESSESELATEDKSSVVEKKDFDFEVENLILHDMSELDEDSVVDLTSFAFETPKVCIPSRQQRLEVTVKPIDRPRSTTPINASTLEAFIQSVSPTFVSKVEKIKLSLPGEQFVGKLKSPKKASARSWTDFCESGLHSPKMHRKMDKGEFDPFGGSDNDAKWAAFDSTFESSCFGDNFMDVQTIPKESGRQFIEGFSHLSCSCECHRYGCGSCAKDPTAVEVGIESEDIKCEKETPCLCSCHKVASSAVVEQCGPSDNFLQCDIGNGLDCSSQN